MSIEPNMEQQSNLERLREVGEALGREWRDMRTKLADLEHLIIDARAAILAGDNERLHQLIREAPYGGTR